MNDIFGIPMDAIMVTLAVTLVIFLLSVGWVAWRRPVVFKLGVRNIPRRKAQSTLIVAGVMLSTLIMAAALGTGDTVYHSITSGVYDNLGHVDEVVVVSQDTEATVDLTSQVTLPSESLALVEEAVTGDPNVDGIMPMLEVRVAIQNDRARLAEPDVVLAGLDPTRLGMFGGLQTLGGKTVDFGAIGTEETVISQKLAGEINAVAGDRLTVFVNDTAHPVTVAAIAQDSYLSGTRRSKTSGLEFSGMVMTLTELQALIDRPGEISAIAISNTGGVRDALDYSDGVTSHLKTALAGTGLGVDAIKSNRVSVADQTGTTFTTIFVLLGMFSVISGVLLIVLIFTMLASERRPEMGMERAIGGQRRQLIQQFVAEGAGYALVAGLVGVGLGVLAVFGIAEGMRYIFGDYAPVEAHVTTRSLIVAYCLGMVITFLTVVAASWKISRINIVAAVRDIPDLVMQKRRKLTLLWGSLLLLAGGALTLIGASGETASLFSVGMSLLPFGVALILQYLGVSGRAVFTVVGLYLLGFWLLPESMFNDLFGNYDFGIEMFFLSGIFMVIAATLVIMQNTGLLLAAISRVGGLFRSKLPAVRTGVAFPGAARTRTGLTVAMFSLIIFSLVMMATMNHNYTESALGDEANAGWDVRADTSDRNPPADLIAALSEQAVDTSGVSAVGLVTNPSEHDSPVRLSGADEWKNWAVLGVDEAFLNHTGFKFGQRAAGYDSDAAVVEALMTRPDVAVIDSRAVPAEGDIGGYEDAFELTGLKSSDESFEPITVELQSPVDGQPYPITIIGVIDSAIGSLSGLYAGQQTVDAIYPSRIMTSWYVALVDDAHAGQVAQEIESALLANGVQGTSIRDELKDLQRQESGFLLIIEGFMALGLFVGIAAVGVVAFRSVVERRQQIGVLRAIGFQREMVSLSFMIETLFVVGLGVLTGTALGLGLAQRLVSDPDQGFSSDISFTVPWAVIVPILVTTVAVALLMTWIPSQQAGGIAPAEALRYE